MQYWIPAYILIDVPTKDHADAAKRILENLLQNGMVVGAIQAQVPNQGIRVGEPQLANVPPKK